MEIIYIPRSSESVKISFILERNIYNNVFVARSRNFTFYLVSTSNLMRLISVESSVRCRAWRGFGHFGSIRLKKCTFLSKWGHITIINTLFLLTLFVLLVKNSNASDFCRKLCQMQSVTRIWALEHFVWLGDWKSAHFDQNEDTPQSSILCFWRDFLFDQLTNFNASDFHGKRCRNTKIIPNQMVWKICSNSSLYFWSVFLQQNRENKLNIDTF